MPPEALTPGRAAGLSSRLIVPVPPPAPEVPPLAAPPLLPPPVPPPAPWAIAKVVPPAISAAAINNRIMTLLLRRMGVRACNPARVSQFRARINKDQAPPSSVREPAPRARISNHQGRRKPWTGTE